jgi:hypothetical protein
MWEQGKTSWDVHAVPSLGLTPVYRLDIGCTERDVLGNHL